MNERISKKTKIKYEAELEKEGDELYQTMEYNKAISKYNEVLSLNPGNSTISFKIAKAIYFKKEIAVCKSDYTFYTIKEGQLKYYGDMAEEIAMPEPNSNYVVQVISGDTDFHVC